MGFVDGAQMKACQIYCSSVDCCPACVDCSRSLHAGLLFVPSVFPLNLLVAGRNKTKSDRTPASFTHQPVMSHASSWHVAWSERGVALGWCYFCCCLQPASPSVSSQCTESIFSRSVSVTPGGKSIPREKCYPLARNHHCDSWNIVSRLS